MVLQLFAQGPSCGGRPTPTQPMTGPRLSAASEQLEFIYCLRDPHGGGRLVYPAFEGSPYRSVVARGSEDA